MAKIEPKIFDELKTALVSFGDKYFVGEELNRSKLTDDLRNYDEALLSKLFDEIDRWLHKELAKNIVNGKQITQNIIPNLSFFPRTANLFFSNIFFKNKKIVLFLLVLPLVAVLVAPKVALADDDSDWVKNIPIIGGVVDFASDPGGWITDRFAEGAEFFFNDGLQNIKTTSTKSILGKSFNNLLGKKTGTFYSTVSFVNKSVVMPTAASILSLVMLIQLIKISQRIDGTATLPAIKDIVFLIIYATIFIWLLKNSLKICAGAYDLFNEMIGKINQSTVDELKTVTIADSCKESFGAVIGIWVQSMIFDLITIIIKGSVSVMCYMRAMQLYVMAAFSPLPFALLGFDETKNYGVSFCKNFLATCLAGVIILFAMGLFPNLLSGFSGGEISGFKGDMWSSVCASVALMLIVIKSGTIARDVFGG